MSKHMSNDELDQQVDALYQDRKNRISAPKEIEEALITNVMVNKQKSWWQNIKLKQYSQISAVAISCALCLFVVSTHLIKDPSAGDLLISAGITQAENKELSAYANRASEASAFKASAKLSEKTRAGLSSDLSSDLSTDVSTDLSAGPRSFKIVYHILDSSDVLANRQGASAKFVQKPELAMQEKFAADKTARLQDTLARQVKYQQANASYLQNKQDLSLFEHSYATIVNNQDGLHLLTCEQELLKISNEVLKLLTESASPSQAQRPSFIEGNLLSLRFDEQGHIVQLVDSPERKQC